MRYRPERTSSLRHAISKFIFPAFSITSKSEFRSPSSPYAISESAQALTALRLFTFMASEKQIAANRRNSQHSSGPRTDAGKSVSRLNALKSGIHAQSLTIRGEDPEALAQLAAEYNAEFHPTTPRQRDLVDTLVRNEWKIRRLERIEAEIWEGEFDYEDNRSFDPDNSNHLRRRLLPLRSAFLDIENRLDRLQRRIHAYERSTARALKELRGVGLLACPPAEGRQAVETEAISPEIGFVPSTAALSPDPRSLTAQTTEGSPLRIGFVPSTAAALSPDPRSLTPQTTEGSPSRIGFVPQNSPRPSAS